jgi:hypothetical protein
VQLCSSVIPMYSYKSWNWVGPRARLDIIQKKKIFCPCQDSNSILSGPEPGHSSKYTTLAQYFNLPKSLLTTNCMKQGPWEIWSLSAIQEVATPLCNLSMFAVMKK